MNLVSEKDEILKEECIPFDFQNPQIDPLKIFEELRDTMVEKRGVGLAAPQIGQPYRVFVMGNPDEKETIVGCFNPIITSVIDETDVEMEEGCLSFPGLFIKIKRPRAIRVRYTTYDGSTNAIKFEGMTARIFQHELDHLNGVVFTDRATKFRLSQARAKRKINMRRMKKKGIL